MRKITAWYSVDKNDRGFIYEEKPTRGNDEWKIISGEYEDVNAWPMFEILKLPQCQGLTWANEPVELYLYADVAHGSFITSEPIRADTLTISAPADSPKVLVHSQSAADFLEKVQDNGLVDLCEAKAAIRLAEMETALRFAGVKIPQEGTITLDGDLKITPDENHNV